MIKGDKRPQTLFNRLEAQRSRALNRGEIGRYLVTFVDNHDSFWQPTGRFPSGATEAASNPCATAVPRYADPGTPTIGRIDCVGP